MDAQGIWRGFKLYLQFMTTFENVDYLLKAANMLVSIAMAGPKIYATV